MNSSARSLAGEQKTVTYRETMESIRAERDTAIQAAQVAVFNTTRLTRLLTILSEPAPIQSLLDRLLETLSELFVADIVVILDPVGSGSFSPLATLGIPEDMLHYRFSEEKDGYVITTMETGRPILLPLAKTDPKIESHLHELDIETAVCIPIAGSNTVRGVLFLARCRSHPFDKNDVELLTTMSYRIGLVIEQAQRSIQIEQIEQISRKISHHLDQLAICVDAVQSFHPIIGADASVLAVLDVDKDDFVVDRDGVDSLKHSVWKELAGHYLQGQYFVDHEPLYIPPQMIPDGNKNIKTLVATPIFISGQLKGLLFAVRFSTILFGPDALKIAKLYAGQISAALENARLYQEARQELKKRQQVEKTLENLAFQDTLTGLANRTFFIKKLQNVLAYSEDSLDTVALIFLDLDNFKIVNDSLGHEIGDSVLKSVAGRILTCLRTEDLAARLGGDEFTILIENLRSLDQITLIARRILNVFRAPILIESRELYLNCSIGIAISFPGENDPEDLLRKADLAMYEAKGKGKGCYAIYDANMNDRAIARLELESELRFALQHNELQVYYQPIFSLSGYQIVEIEALLRWNHPSRGLILPTDIIPLAEETGLIIDIGKWLLREASLQIHSWNQKYGYLSSFSLSVNLSARQLHSSELVKDVQDAISYSQIAPSSLVLEITESSLIQDSETTMSRLTALRDIGVRMALDDFGVGYASLNYLKRFPVDILKIDRSFVQGIVSDERDKAIVRNMIDLGKAFGLKVVGEGIETQEQAMELTEMGCNLGQGFLYSAPLSAKAFEERFLTKNKVALIIP
ncbi:MAG: EAL domain-containing protein [Anaerolineales bacterium]|nr:EAL domain-containing protein [Anaerolineales bacterium]